ncbi:MAG: DUF805 domain-containing protein [Paracoccaceae bacterium]
MTPLALIRGEVARTHRPVGRTSRRAFAWMAAATALFWALWLAWAIWPAAETPQARPTLVGALGDVPAWGWALVLLASAPLASSAVRRLIDTGLRPAVAIGLVAWPVAAVLVALVWNPGQVEELPLTRGFVNATVAQADTAFGGIVAVVVLSPMILAFALAELTLRVVLASIPLLVAVTGGIVVAALSFRRSRPAPTSDEPTPER